MTKPDKNLLQVKKPAGISKCSNNMDNLRAAPAASKSLGITQILILLIGIFAFSYMLGELGKSQGIEVSRKINFVGAQQQQQGFCDSDAQCEAAYTEGWMCNLLSGDCEEGVEIIGKDEQGNEVKTKVPESKSGSAGEALSYINTVAGTTLTIKQIFNIGGKKVDPTTQTITQTTTAGGAGTPTGMGPPTYEQWLAQQAAGADKSFWMRGGGAESAAPWTAYLYSFLAAVGTAALIYVIFKWAGAGQQNLNMISNGGIIGALTGTAASWSLLYLTAISTGGAVVVAVAVTAIFVMGWTLAGYQDYVKEIIEYKISAWQPAAGGAKCDECNKQEFGCTEYQCRTFGQGCGIVNAGTKQERCTWVNPDDREYPAITEDAEISQLPEGYSYKKSTIISPPDTGVEITSNAQKCIPPFSSLVLGVKTDEIAQCKISAERKKNFESVTSEMDEGLIQIETHTKRIPNTATANDWALNNLVDNSALPDGTEFEITKGNEYEYYIRCRDTNGNENPANFIIKFCVQDKDLTAPIVNGFFVGSGSFVQFNTPEVTTEVYTNEPAECKWDFSDKTFDNMQNTMANCDTTINEATYFGNSCTAIFTGLKNGEENKYYVRCQDRSPDKNTNVESEIYTLKVSSKSVLIDSISVNGKGNNSIIKDARDVIPVDLKIITTFGAEEGKAKCQYNYLGSWIDMSFDYAQENMQTLWLPEGSYTLPISCNDIAGDTDTGSISFTVVEDRDMPIVARTYYDVNNLKVITNEPAECAYSNAKNIGCAYDFSDGTAMSAISETVHYTPWQANKKYYIKCKDSFGNQPLPGDCSIIVRAYESYGSA